MQDRTAPGAVQPSAQRNEKGVHLQQSIAACETAIAKRGHWKEGIIVPYSDKAIQFLEQRRDRYRARLEKLLQGIDEPEPRPARVIELPPEIRRLQAFRAVEQQQANVNW